MKTSRRASTLPVSFFDRPADLVARELLGAVMVSRIGGGRTAGRIVETEAYLGYHDPASHGYLHRRNERNAALFGSAGSWYVYLSYGIHWCANLVCQEPGTAGAVLIRALEPLDGLALMRRRRGGVDDRRLCSGPGNLCQALGITHALDGRIMSSSPVVVLAPPRSWPAPVVYATPRIGITKAADWLLRFHLEGNGYVSGGQRGGGAQERGKPKPPSASR